MTAIVDVDDTVRGGKWSNLVSPHRARAEEAVAENHRRSFASHVEGNLDTLTQDLHGSTSSLGVCPKLAISW